MTKAKLLDNGKFITKNEFKKNGYLGAGGTARFRNLLWAAAFSSGPVKRFKQEKIDALAAENKAKVNLMSGL